MQRVLIVGVDSVLGSNLALEFTKWFDVCGLYSRFPIEVDGCRTEQQAAGDDGLLAQIDRIAPQRVIFSGALSQSSWNEFDRSTNDASVIRPLLTGCDELEYTLTVVSSDAVFTGPRLFHAEFDFRLATGALAREARQVEQLLEGTSALLVRTHAYGWSPVPDFVPGIERLWNDIRFSSKCPLDSGRHATPILASDLALLLCRAMDCELTGLYHIAGAERINPHRFGSELASILGLPRRHVRFTRTDVRDNASIGIETSLVTRRVSTTLKTSMPLVRDGLKRLAEQAEQGYASQLHATEFSRAA